LKVTVALPEQVCLMQSTDSTSHVLVDDFDLETYW
jgi:hypothetical protein